MKMKLKKSIGFKMAVAMTIGLFVVISFFSHTNVRISEKRLLAMAESEASKMSNAIKSSLDSAMLANRAEDVQVIIDAVGQENMVKDIKVIDLNGQVKHAKNKVEVGSQLDQREKSCAICHSGAEVRKANLTVMFSLANGDRILRNVNPIHNEPRCQACHPADEKILGKLLVDFSTIDIDQTVVDNRKLLILSAVVTLITSVAMCFLLASVLVKKPLYNLLIKMKSADDNQEREAEISGEDEVAILNETYDSLMAVIEERNRQIKQQMDDLMALFNVSEILNKSESIEANVELILDALQIGFQVEECAILLLDHTSFQKKGCLGMDNAKAESLSECLARPELLDQIKQGQTFMATDCGGQFTDFLVVPLKAANAILGVITVHSLKGMAITDEKLRQSFGIIATSLAPHFQIGLAQSAKQEMRVSPFTFLVDSVDKEIAKVREYMGSLSVAKITVANYQEISQTRGIAPASDLVQEIAVRISANISAVHECTRISEDTLILILPMLDAFEAPGTVHAAMAALDNEVTMTVKIATYPDNGQTALELVVGL